VEGERTKGSSKGLHCKKGTINNWGGKRKKRPQNTNVPPKTLEGKKPVKLMKVWGEKRDRSFVNETKKPEKPPLLKGCQGEKEGGNEQIPNSYKGGQSVQGLGTTPCRRNKGLYNLRSGKVKVGSKKCRGGLRRQLSKEEDLAYITMVTSGADGAGEGEKRKFSQMLKEKKGCKSRTRRKTPTKEAPGQHQLHNTKKQKKGKVGMGAGGKKRGK